MISFGTALIITATACSMKFAANDKLDPRLQDIQLPEGFQIEIYAENVENARQMALGDKGTIFVGSRRLGKVHAVIDSDGDQKADKVLLVAENLFMPSGLAFKDGALYVAEVNKIWKYADIEQNLTNIPSPELISDAYPDDSHHGWKYLGFGPDGQLYVPVGAPCNICEKEEEIYSSMTRLKLDGSAPEIYAKGIRNSVGFDWHPVTGDLWFTENGRDWLTDDTPPDELNRITEKGQHFGYPYCHGGTLADPKFGDKRECSEFVAPAQNLNAHVAAIGMTFYTGKKFPEKYHNQILIAEHGSWNRKEPDGYRITCVTLDKDSKATSYEVFAEGWLKEDEAWGRPSDVLMMPDGSILVSDDTADLIYRISYKG